MAESDQRAEAQQPFGLGGGRGADAEAEELASAPEQSRITGGIRRGSQQEDLCLGGHTPDLAKVPRLQASADREQFRQRNLPRQLFPAQFDQPQRVSARLGDDPLAYPAVNAARHPRREQLPGLLGWKAPDLHPGIPSRSAVRSDGPRTANSIAIASAPSRRAMKPRMPADSRSSHCASSTTHSSGRSVTALASMISAARATRKRSGESARRRPSAPLRASRCGAGRDLSPARNGSRADAAQRS